MTGAAGHSGRTRSRSPDANEGRVWRPSLALSSRADDGIRTRLRPGARRYAQSAVDSDSELCVNPHTWHGGFGLDSTTRHDLESSLADPEGRRSVLRNRLLPALA